MSQANASSIPPPKAKPFTAAITGCGKAPNLEKIAFPNSDCFAAASRSKSFNSVMSAPAAKAFSPDPVTITAFTVSSFWIMSIASLSSVNNCWFRAFRAFGRLSVMYANEFLTS